MKKHCNMPYIVLSRKYRPTTLDEIVGQPIVVKSLKACLDNNKVPHAFLLYGIRGVGKTTIARIIAKCLSCKDSIPQSNPCGKCQSCVEFDNNNHLDIIEIDAASRTGVDDIRDIIDACQYSPVLGKYKIFIIDEVHMLSKSAFNALLKTLEEPPAHVKFIFATTEINKIPETIASRCISLQLKSIPFDTLSKYLIDIANKEGCKLNIESANIISEESEGSVRDALSILEQAIMLANDSKEIISDDILQMIGSTKLQFINDLLDNIISGKVKESLTILENIKQQGGDSFNVFKQLQQLLYRAIKEVAYDNNTKYKLSHLLYLWQILVKQTENIKNSIFPEYILNATVVMMAYTSSLPKLEEIINNNTKKETSNRAFLDEVLKQFPGANITEVY
ncbi:MAG: DNA polymerase III subunit gamma/tau [Alphaproteobacteria bacterium]|nr:DNA polymerase III subunit gamma/tau [Alphaproteobacteria bacterium]